MATLCKPTYSRAIPADAKIVTKDDKRFARFKHKGKVITAPLTKDGKKCRVATDEWYVRYKDEHGEWQRKKAYTDKTASETLMVETQKQVDRKLSGHADPFEEHHKRPLAEHLADFKASLEAKNIAPKHCRDVASRVQKIIDGCKFQRIGDIQASRVQTFLHDLRVEGRSLQTLNHHLGSIKHFTRWLITDRRTGDDRLAHLARFNTETDRRHDRRAMGQDEFARLVAAAETGKTIEGVSGPDRAMMYVLAAWTGFRRKELNSLTRRSFDLDDDTPTVRVLAAYAKGKRTDDVPLHTAVVERLRKWLATQGDLGPDERLFSLQTPGGHWRKTNKMMRKDLEAAREAWIDEAETPAEQSDRERSDFLTYQDEDGLFADFHSNRHTFISNLGKAKVDLTMAQKLARHSTPTLTSNVYTHLRISDKAAAIESLPAPPGESTEDSREVAEMRATGTDDARPIDTPPEDKNHRKGDDRLPPACQKPGRMRRLEARPGREGAEGDESTEEPQILSMAGFGTAGQGPAEARPAGFEPATCGLEVRCSIH